MKSVLLISLIATILTSSIALAQTTLNTNWEGAGFLLAINFVADDDAELNFTTAGDYIEGELNAVDSNDNPYNYQVDTVDSKIKASVENGWLKYSFLRTDSLESKYGDAGQQSYTFIEADSINFAWHSNSNYARLRNCNYGWQNDNQIQASGEFLIVHGLYKGDYGAEIYQAGNGETKITSMSEEYWGDSFKFGKGCGCYTNAKVETTGEGEFTLTAIAPNQITTDFGVTVSGGTLVVYAEYDNGFTFDNFALEGE